MFGCLIVLLADIVILYFSGMASTIPLGLKYAYVLLRKKMDMQQNSPAYSAILCRYGDTEDVCLIGGLVDIGE